MLLLGRLLRHRGASVVPQRHWHEDVISHLRRRVCTTTTISPTPSTKGLTLPASVHQPSFFIYQATITNFKETKHYSTKQNFTMDSGKNQQNEVRAPSNLRVRTPDH